MLSGSGQCPGEAEEEDPEEDHRPERGAHRGGEAGDSGPGEVRHREQAEAAERVSDDDGEVRQSIVVTLLCPLSRFLDEYYRKQFESRTETVQMASNDQMAQESVTMPRLGFL